MPDSERKEKLFIQDSESFFHRINSLGPSANAARILDDPSVPSDLGRKVFNPDD
jgi:hypothetical protein